MGVVIKAMTIVIASYVWKNYFSLTNIINMVSSSKKDVFGKVLKVLVTIAAIFYALIFIDEAFPPYDPDMRESDFGIVMVFILFIWFGIGYYFLWKNEKWAGIMLITWWLGLFLTAWQVWMYGNVTVVLGFPIFVLGILLFINSNRKESSSY